MAWAADCGSVARANGKRRRVGFIGLAGSGKAMASSLLKAAHQLILYDPDREMAESLARFGAKVAHSIRDVCGSADVVFTMLPNEDVAEAVILGPDGVVDSLPGRAIHIGSSTVGVECSDRIVEGHWNTGKQYVSAPVLGCSASTADEHLLVIAAGHEAAIIEVEPLLRQIGQLAQVGGWPSDANLVLASLAQHDDRSLPGSDHRHNQADEDERRRVDQRVSQVEYGNSCHGHRGSCTDGARGKQTG